MRLDKFLKLSRLIRRRTIAKQAIDNGFVSVNDKIQKPGYKVKVGDEIEIKFAVKIIKVKVTRLTLEKDSLMYTILSEKRVTT